MKLPAVAIASTFACGIAMSWPAIHLTTSHSQILISTLGAASLLLVVSCVLLSKHLSAAGVTTLLAWLALGVAGGVVSHEPKPANYVVSLSEAGAFDLHTPLRWHGHLRDEPERLPWGVALEVELSSVDFAERNIPLQGGMRLSYTPRDTASLPEIHTGDDISVVTQARLPQVFRDEGAFNRRAYLRDQGIDLTSTLRAPELLDVVSPGPLTANSLLARTRRHLREQISLLLPAAPQEAAVLRAMLLGDRSFLERSESVDFQKTGAFHVLVVAGLHVGAFAAFLFWLARRFRLSRAWTSIAVLVCVAAYVAVVEQRPPVLRAALMTFVVIVAMFFFRRVELPNSVAVAALILLVVSPGLLADSSFQLSFLAMFCIAGLAAPWIERSIEPYARGVRGWRDVTRDVSHPPRVAQFRIDLRSISTWIESKLPSSIAPRCTNVCARLLGLTFRVAEMLVLFRVAGRHASASRARFPPDYSLRPAGKPDSGATDGRPGAARISNAGNGPAGSQGGDGIERSTRLAHQHIAPLDVVDRALSPLELPYSVSATLADSLVLRRCANPRLHAARTFSFFKKAVSNRSKRWHSHSVAHCDASICSSFAPRLA